ncbi:sporulation protein YpjB [Paenibacillus popilliae]|nr:sporulation protein YpjB [Paenibacillus popilliae]
MLFRRSRWLVILVIVVGIIGMCTLRLAPAAVAIGTNSMAGKPEESWLKLDQQAEAIYQAVKKQELERARQLVQKMGESMTDTSFYGATGVEGVRALSDAIVQVKRALPAVERNEERLMHVTARLRLASDALIHKKQAMWLQYEQMLRDEMNRMKQVKQEKEWLSSAKQWLLYVDRIRPAATIQRSPETVEVIDSLVRLVERAVAKQAPLAEVNQALNRHGDEWLRQLFGKTKDAPTFGQEDTGTLPLQWTLLFTFIVCSVLFYVAVQKYRYEHDSIRPGHFRK